MLNNPFQATCRGPSYATRNTWRSVKDWTTAARSPRPITILGTYIWPWASWSYNETGENWKSAPKRRSIWWKLPNTSNGTLLTCRRKDQGWTIKNACDLLFALHVEMSDRSMNNRISSVVHCKCVIINEHEYRSCMYKRKGVDLLVSTCYNDTCIPIPEFLCRIFCYTLGPPLR